MRTDVRQGQVWLMPDEMLVMPSATPRAVRERRPVVVLTCNALLERRAADTVLVAPLSTAMDRLDERYDVVIPPQPGGLERESRCILSLTQPMLVEDLAQGKCVGALNEFALLAIRNRLAEIFGAARRA